MSSSWYVGRTGGASDPKLSGGFLYSGSGRPHPVFHLEWNRDPWSVSWLSSQSMYELLVEEGTLPDNSKVQLDPLGALDELPVQTFLEVRTSLPGVIEKYGVPQAQRARVSTTELELVVTNFCQVASISASSSKKPRLALDDLREIMTSTNHGGKDSPWFGDVLWTGLRSVPLIVDALDAGQTWESAIALANQPLMELQ